MDGDTTFQDILRPHLPGLGPDAGLPESQSLTDLGLDSMQVVQLLLELEERYGITFPDEMLTAETFATAGSLRQAVSSLTGG